MGKGTDSESVQSNAQVTLKKITLKIKYCKNESVYNISLIRLRSPVGHVFCVDLIHKLNIKL